jgi:hypothetical protein
VVLDQTGVLIRPTIQRREHRRAAADHDWCADAPNTLLVLLEIEGEAPFLDESKRFHEVFDVRDGARGPA